ncbi:MAG: HPr family phosphocarrier protein [Verrucomicrobiota bacterium]
MESETSAISRELVLNNELGLHARPAAMFVKTASRFRSEVWVEMDEEQVNGKSIMGLMMLAAPGGATLTVSAEGDDANEALDSLASLFESGFQEN